MEVCHNYHDTPNQIVSGNQVWTHAARISRGEVTDAGDAHSVVAFLNWETLPILSDVNSMVCSCDQ